MTRLYSPGTSLSFIETDALAKTYIVVPTDGRQHYARNYEADKRMMF